jgi:SAM-dependent methyltransferase
MNLERKQAFERIYSEHKWGGVSRSGPGSDPEQTGNYVHFVNKWLSTHSDVREVVEFGCGDWATTRLVNLGAGRSYRGLDIVPAVLEENRRRFGNSMIQFQCCDFLTCETPAGDLLLVKDVLQHLSNNSVTHFLKNILTQYRYALITNDLKRYVERRIMGIWPIRRLLATPNVDIVDGGSRPLRLDDRPFNLDAVARFRYPVVLQPAPHRVIYVKEVLVWKNPNC